MSLEEKLELIKLNRRFYEHFSNEFASTRQGFWQGWERLLPLVGGQVLDVAAGNLRFKKFLDEKRVAYSGYFGIDGELSLLQSSGESKDCYQQLDILEVLAAGQDWTKQVRDGGADDTAGRDFDFVICSAFLHHVPGRDWREEIVQQLLSLAKPGGGKAVVSLWRFLDTPKIAGKIAKDLGNGDYLLSWQSCPTPLRYCHHFGQKDIDQLKAVATTAGAKLLDEYEADGQNHSANHYLVWER